MKSLPHRCGSLFFDKAACDVTSPEVLSCRCACGEAGVNITVLPQVRFRCHCGICQRVYQADFADATIVCASDARRETVSNVEFKRYRRPPALDRGSCVSCGRPVVGYLTLAPFLKLAFIPAANFPTDTALPGAAMDVFCESNTSDAGGELPEYRGYISSELALSRLVLRNYRRIWGSGRARLA